MSDDVIDELGRFSAASEESKLEKFEQSTLALILLQLGAPRAVVKRLQAEREMEFNCDWFNSLDLVPATVYTNRFFRFNMNELFEKPAKSPITQEVAKLQDDSFILVFKAYEFGRLVATNAKVADYTHLHIATPGVRKFNILYFNNFFTNHFGQAAADLI